jgi:hypothetical protein
MALETALARYYSAKNTFYDTLDTIADTTRVSSTCMFWRVVGGSVRVCTKWTEEMMGVVVVWQASVKAVKTVSRAVVETPARVTQTVNDAKALATDVAETVKRTTDQVRRSLCPPYPFLLPSPLTLPPPPLCVWAAAHTDRGVPWPSDSHCGRPGDCRADHLGVGAFAGQQDQGGA